MSKTDHATSTRRLGDLITGGHTVMMLTTTVGGIPSSRPVTCLEVADGRLSFLVSAETDWVRAITDDAATVHVTLADERHNTYVALNGVATVTADPAERDRLWNPVAKVWFTGPDDPATRVLRVDVTAGEWWDGPSGTIGRTLGLLRAVVTKDDDALGDQGTVAPG